jgi:hypothetical protein
MRTRDGICVWAESGSFVLQLLLELQESFSVSIVCRDCFSEVGDFVVGEVEGEVSTFTDNYHAPTLLLETSETIIQD